MTFQLLFIDYLSINDWQTVIIWLTTGKSFIDRLSKDMVYDMYFVIYGLSLILCFTAYHFEIYAYDL